jgi:arylformamidase
MLYDLSQPIATGMTYFPGDPEPRVAPYPATPPWRVSDVHVGSHSGTHMDAPAHISRGTTIDQIPLERLVGPGVVVDVRGKRPGERIGLADVSPEAQEHLRRGRWAVFCTGWSRNWGTPAYLAHPSLDPALARTLVEWGVGLAAMDMLNPDDTATGAAVVHETLLGAGVLIVENLTGLERLSAGQVYTFAFLPLKLSGGDGAPLRAVAWDTVDAGDQR